MSKITKEELAKIVEKAEDLDANVMVDLAHEFLQEVNHKRPADVISPNAGGVSWVLIRDRALTKPTLTKATLEIGIEGVPPRVVTDFTIGLMLGLYLASKGEGSWPHWKPKLNN